MSVSVRMDCSMSLPIRAACGWGAKKIGLWGWSLHVVPNRDSKHSTKETDEGKPPNVIWISTYNNNLLGQCFRYTKLYVPMGRIKPDRDQSSWALIRSWIWLEKKGWMSWTCRESWRYDWRDALKVFHSTRSSTIQSNVTYTAHIKDGGWMMV